MLTHFFSSDLVLNDEEKKNVALFYIEELMHSRGSSLRKFEDMQYPNDMFISDLVSDCYMMS